jgi:hypothetical protein
MTKSGNLELLAEYASKLAPASQKHPAGKGCLWLGQVLFKAMINCRPRSGGEKSRFKFRVLQKGDPRKRQNSEYALAA